MSLVTKVTFKVQAKAKRGEKIHLAGDIWSLGGFKSSRAVELVTTPEEYPIWRTSKRINLPTGKPIEYKYAIFSGGNFVRYERIGKHSRYIIPQGEEMVIQDVFGEPQSSNSGSSSSRQEGDLQGETSTTLAASQQAQLGYTASPPHIFYEKINNPSSQSSTIHSRISPRGNTRVPSKQHLGAVQIQEHSQSTLPNESSTESSSENASMLKEGEEDPAKATSDDDLSRPSDILKLGRNKVFLIAFHLPVKLHRNVATGGWSASWNLDNIVARSENSIAEDNDAIWVGAITYHSLDNVDANEIWGLDDETKREITRVLNDMGCHPIFLEKEVYDVAYSKFCKSTLRHIFHNVLELEDDESRSDKTITAFRTLNQEFADTVMSLMNKSEYNDVVWVHDYHLMLVPKLIREEVMARNKRITQLRRAQLSEKPVVDSSKAGGPEQPSTSSEFVADSRLYAEPRIVFFLHIPFPTSEIFRTLSVRAELLLGMLSANVVGFHTFSHARHFLTACKRFLGLSYHSRKGGNLMVDCFGRSVLIALSHVGIEPQRLDTMLRSPFVTQKAKAIKECHGPKAVILAGYDELTRLSGIPLKLLAYEKLLQECEEYRTTTVFIQHGIKPSTKSKEVLQSIAEVKQLVQRIVQTYGPVVVYKEHEREPPTAYRVALWKCAHVMVSTPVMEGLNLLPLEYQYAHQEPGVVIVSEFSANSRVLNGAIRVNSYDIDSVSSAMNKAIRMEREERQARRERDIDYISNRKSSNWTRDIIREVESSVTKEDEVITAIDDSEALGSESVMAVQHKMEVNACSLLSQPTVAAAYRKSKRRVFFLDYGGTICARELENIAVKTDFMGVSKRKLEPRVVEVIRRLSANPRNAVFVVSGNSRTVLSQNFAEILQDKRCNLGLVAHSGLCVRWGNISRHDQAAPLERMPSAASMEEKYKDDDVRFAEEKFRAEGWEMVLKGVAQEWGEWMDAAKVGDILEDITWYTAGSVWRQSPVTTIWDFRQADPEQGGINANVVHRQLEEAIEKINVPVAIVRKKNSVQLLPKGVSKGTAVKHILANLKEKWHGDQDEPDFFVCMGDDSQDELAFTELLSALAEDTHHMYRPFHHKSNLTAEEEIREVFTVTVGRKPTEAQHYVNDSADVIDLLAMLSDIP